jgi:hypothetical protein
MHERIEMSGRRFDRLRVVAYAGNYTSVPGHASALWRCRCGCGREVTVRGPSLRASLGNQSMD